MPNNTESSSQILQAFHEQDIRSNRETYDSGNLSEVNLAHNNITFHVYPVLKITNERSGGRGDCQEKMILILIISYKSN